MKCKIDGCDREAAYKAQCVCQKHYFRYMRNGHYGKNRARKHRTQNAKGYQMIFNPEHVLAMGNGYVYEHRMMVYEKYGDELPNCCLCDRVVSWSIVHIDHIDRDITNNDVNNLRPLCRYCNTHRDYNKPWHTRINCHAITYNGETKTPEEWGRDPRVKVKGSTIRQRLFRGLSAWDCLFMPKKTHKELG